MIDAFRWATLRDPQLPAALLPADWPGHQARALCHELYRQLYMHTRRHLAATTQDSINLSTIPTLISSRFDGL